MMGTVDQDIKEKIVESLFRKDDKRIYMHELESSFAFSDLKEEFYSLLS
jgi:hypothetical protein